MAERAIHRKSQLIFNSVLPVKNTHYELVKKKLETGKFPFTVTGIIKILGILTLLAGISLYLAKPACANPQEWYGYFYLVAVAVDLLSAVVLYTIFSAGFTVQHPGKWIKIDMFVNSTISIFAIASSVVDSSKCQAVGSIHKIPGLLGIIGGSILIVSCAAIFLMYRYREDEEEPEHTTPARVDPRKSLHV